MQTYRQPVVELISRRRSCRSYQAAAIPEQDRRRLQEFIGVVRTGPFGTALRFMLAASSEEDRQALHGLGTYGFIRGNAGFIIGAMEISPKNLEDFGYALERIILFATDLGLGTCWLGGSYNRSAFTSRIAASPKEEVPAVAAVGISKKESTAEVPLPKRIRLPWNRLFFQDDFRQALTEGSAGKYDVPLEMLRGAPSASNKQPWRIVRRENDWHFFLQRTKGYRSGIVFQVLGVSDMQRIDMGIAMCHFELTCREMGLPVSWCAEDPGGRGLPQDTEYIATWKSKTE
jgi:nitroreductase